MFITDQPYPEGGGTERMHGTYCYVSVDCKGDRDHVAGCFCLMNNWHIVSQLICVNERQRKSRFVAFVILSMIFSWDMLSRLSELGYRRLSICARLFIDWTITGLELNQQHIGVEYVI